MTRDPIALCVFAVLFLGAAFLGTLPMRLRPRGHGAGSGTAHEEWGLGGRRFGVWVTWFLVGGDFYTAYTVIAVPALVYGQGAYGFFALPYTIIVYPFIFATMPLLWRYAQKHGYMTAADIVRGRFGSRTLELAVALTGLVAVLPYIALQLVGIQTVIHALGLPGQIPLVVAFVSLALYTWLGGLHAPALTAFIKDVMIYIVVIAAVTIIPLHLGGYGHVFDVASSAYTKPGTGLLLADGKMMPYATLALGSALAAFLYPHTLTGVLASRSAQTIRTNAVMLPAYTLLLGLIAMLGYMAHAAGVHVAKPNDTVPALFAAIFPSWFLGFAYAAVAIGALVPASVMAIGAANLVTRNIIGARAGRATEAREAKIVGLLVKLAALGCVLLLNPQYAIWLQTLGGVWILQTLPALICGLFIPWLGAPGLIAGWLAGMVIGNWLVFSDGLVPTHSLAAIGLPWTVYTGLIALAANLALSLALSALLRPGRVGARPKPAL